MENRISKTSKPSVIFRIIRDYIAEGTWKPGDKFSSFEIAKMLGVGRSSVNESIKLLESKGFIYILPNVGFGVHRIELKGIQVFLEIHLELMKIASRYLIYSEKKELINSLKSNMKLIMATYQIEEYGATVSGIEEFYLELFSLLEVSYLTTMLSNTVDLQYYCMVQIKNYNPAELKDLINFDRKYLEAIIISDLEKAEFILEEKTKSFFTMLENIEKEYRSNA